MSNYVTLQDARNASSRVVGGGTCDPDVLDRLINEACARLLTKSLGISTLVQVRVLSTLGYFPLPRECSKIVAARVENISTPILPMHQEFLFSGPGDTAFYTYSTSNLLDMGYFSLMYDVPQVEEQDKEFRFVALSVSSQDINKKVTLFGVDSLGNQKTQEVAVSLWRGSEGVVGPDLASLPYASMSNLLYWSKPNTVGYISLFCYDPDTNVFHFLAKAHPDDTTPKWRRYRVVGVSTPCYLYLLCKLGAVKAVRPTDILPIQNLSAIRNMVACVFLEESGNLQAAVSYEAIAMRLLAEQDGEEEITSGTIGILDIDSEFMQSARKIPGRI